MVRKIDFKPLILEEYKCMPVFRKIPTYFVILSLTYHSCNHFYDIQ